MARPERNNVDYFPHPCKHGKKMHYIEKKYKNDGYATWMKLLEELGDADYHYLDIKDNIELMYLSSRCGVSEELLIDIITDLVDLNEFNRQLFEEKILFNQKFINSISDAYKRRNNKLIQLQDICKHLISIGRLNKGFMLRKNNNKPQRIEEDRIEENTKEELWEKFKLIREKIYSNSQIEITWCRQLKLKPDQLKKGIQDFFNECHAKEDIYRSEIDYKSYCFNWIKKNVSKYLTYITEDE
jgi:hypothetical protein